MARAALAALLASLCLGACGGDGEAPGAPVRELTFQLFGDPEELAIYRELGRDYQARTGVRVRLIEVGDRKDHLAKLTASIAARRLPDVFLLNYRNMGGYAARGAIDPAGPRMDAGGGLERDAFYPVTLDAFEFDGELQCVPQNASSLVVYVNEELFARAGLEVPRRWTFAEFVAAAQRLTRGAVDGVAIEPDAIRTAPFVWGAGGELVDDAEEPTRFTLDTPGAQRGLRALVSLHARGLTPTRREAGAKGAEERFLAGEVAMFLSSRREVPVLRTIDDFDWDVAPFPVIERPASVLHSDGFCLARGGEADAAWEFVEFALGPRGARVLARGGRTVPSLRAVAESDAFLDPGAPPASSRVFLDQIATMRRLPTTRNWTQIEESFDLAIEEAFYGRLSLRELVERIADETDGRF